MTGMPPHARCHVPEPLPVGPALRRGWRITRYAAGREAARLGHRAPGLDALLARAGLRQAAFLGAGNPLSRRRPAAWNRAMLDRLRLRARRAGIAFLDGEGRAERPAWAEDHLLLLTDPRRAAALARRFRQHAILCVRLRARSFLRVLR